MVTKLIRVMRASQPNRMDEYVTFSNHDSAEDPDYEAPYEVLSLSREGWEALGEPKTLTMTLLPGNLL